MKIRLSASQVAAADDCRRLHWYRSIAKVQVEALAANLAFGKSVDSVIREYLDALTRGTPAPDTQRRFRELWAEQRDEHELSYASTQTPEDFTAIGEKAMEEFPAAWEQTGFTVVTDASGNPLLDLRLEAFMGEELGIKLWWVGILDIVVYTREMDTAVIDAKTSATVHSPLFTIRAEQLTGYQILLDAHRQQLGIPQVDKLGFLDVLKRKSAPHIPPPVVVPKRSPEELAEFRQKLFWIADDIRRKRFPKVSRMQYNTPCALCDFSGHCVRGDTEGLIFPDQPQIASVQR
jgi:PD-(D/E)XK nuclease superfamily protein